MAFVSRIGQSALTRLRLGGTIVAVAWATLIMALRPRFWPRTVRHQLSRQILFSGVHAVGLTMMIAVLTGVTVVVQAHVALGEVGQTGMLGPLLVAVIIREMAPLLVNFIVIGRSGTAISAELATMQVRGEVALLDSQGVDPMVYLVMPRVIAFVLTVFSLTVCFCVVALVSGFVFSFLLGVASDDPRIFTDSVMRAVTHADFYNVLAKTLLPGLTTGTIACVEGLTVVPSATEVPKSVTRSVVRSIGALLLISAIVSLLTYT